MQKLLINDYNKIKEYLEDANYEGYNSNFVTMMMWNHEYHVQYEIHDNFMVMLQNYNTIHYFSMPFCKKEYYQEAIDYMISYAKVHHFDFFIDCVVEEVKQEIQNIYNDRLLYIRTPYNDDYIYEKKSLETLSGKKMQKRRNHFNAFLKEEHNFIYKEIEVQDIDNVLKCLRQWDSSHDNDESVQSEYIGIIYLLTHSEELNIKTGCIYINDVLEAFIIGSPLQHQTIQIHVEKANKDIRGLYVAICKYFLENNYSEFIYVNREEDMGLPYLQQAKQALHPIKMVTKYRIECNQSSIVKAEDKDTEAIKELWLASFEDEDLESTDFYFTTCYQKENTFILKNKNQILSVVQIVPYLIQNANKKGTAYFILGVCTNKDYQNNGCMKKLMHHILSIEPYKQSTILLQAYNPEIYRSFGFHKKYHHQLLTVNQEAYDVDTAVTLKTISNDQLVSLYTTFCENYDGYRIRDSSYYQNYLQTRCLAYNDTIQGVFDNDECLGYVLYHEDNLKINIQELMYIHQNALHKILRYFASKTKDVFVECDVQADIIGKKEIVCTMMSNDIVEDTIDEKLFINEIF